MKPRAAIVHQVAGRTRFRIPERRSDPGYFAHVSEQLGQCPGVESVMTNAITGSVLVVHETDEPDVLIAYARTFELFDTLDGPASALERSRPPADIINVGLRHMDAWVRAETKQSTDLRSVALTGLIAAAVWQMLRGQLFPAAGTLLWYALSVASERRSSGGEQVTPDADYEGVDSPVP